MISEVKMRALLQDCGLLENEEYKYLNVLCEKLEVLKGIRFENDSHIHNRPHTARVLALALAIAQHMALAEAHIQTLCEAALYHDIGRTNDCVDERHGAASYQLYRREWGADPAMDFLLTYHCKEDSDALNELEHLGLDIEETWMLLCILKDADALDRVRLCSHALDTRYLRFTISLTLLSAAHALLQLDEEWLEQNV